MTLNTPLYGWPYPQPSDARGQGANAIRDLALAASQDLYELEQAHASSSANLYGIGNSDATTYALGNNAWTGLGYEYADGNGFSYDGASVWTYTGDKTRWVMVAFGALLAVNGSQPSAQLRLMHNGVEQTTLTHTDNAQSLTACWPARLDPGNTLQLQAVANDGSGSLGGAASYAFLRMVSV